MTKARKFLFILLLLSLVRPALAAPLGATIVERGALFRVWAPHATSVSVKGDFNSGRPLKLIPEGESGIFSGTVTGAIAGDHYQYVLETPAGELTRLDPAGRQLDLAANANVLVDPSLYQWSTPRFVRPALASAVIYELHVGSFNPGAAAWGTYASVIEKLDYLASLGVNYIELLPLQGFATPMNWGYGVSLPDTLEQSYGSPDDLRRLVDKAHQHGLGVLIDVVHNHYSRLTALKCWDGDCTGNGGNYFYAGPHGVTPWGPRPDFSNPTVRALIAQSISGFIDEYKVDGFRWDAVPYITKYLDFDPTAKHETNDEPNPDGISLMKALNQKSHAQQGFISIAEFFGTDPSITRPIAQGGLGFDGHWTGFFPVVDAITQPNLRTIDLDRVKSALLGPADRVIFTESHDEVGHPPRQRRLPTRIDENHPDSLAAKKRTLAGAALMMTSPGIPMIFQGQEFLEEKDFTFPAGTPLDWTYVNTHQGIVAAYRDLISLRKNTPALAGANIQVFHQNDGPKVIAYRRWGDHGSRQAVVLANLGGQTFSKYRIGVPAAGTWTVKFSSDAQTYSADFGGTPHVKTLTADSQTYNGQPYSLELELGAETVIILEN